MLLMGIFGENIRFAHYFSNYKIIPDFRSNYFPILLQNQDEYFVDYKIITHARI